MCCRRSWVVIIVTAILTSHAFMSISNAEDTPRFDCPGTKRALVVSGGGVKGAYQVGALWYLVNVLGCEFDHIFGTSTGAVTAAVLAQAKNQDELKKQIELLRAEYASLKKDSDLIDKKFLGVARVLLPSWLGGVDGLATLAPLERRLREYIRDERAPHEKLTILAVSLQAGALVPQWYRVDNVFDLAIGSASIPGAIEPRLARTWTRAKFVRMTDDILTVDFYVGPGLPDPGCELRINQTKVIRCEQIKGTTDVIVSHRPQTTTLGGLPRTDSSIFISTRTQLKLYDLSAADRDVINKEITRRNTGPAGSGLPVHDDPLGRGPILPGFGPPSTEFTSLHQLVDGGVTDNLPLEYAVGAIGKERGIDTIVTLLAGRTRLIGPEPREAHGLKDILETTFNFLWESYQNQALRAPERYLMLYRNYCDSLVSQNRFRQWREELSAKLGKETLETAEQSMKTKFPADDWSGVVIKNCEEAGWAKWGLWTFDPGAADMPGAISVDPEKILLAFGQGCIRAALQVYDRLMPPSVDYLRRRDDAKKYSEHVCTPLARKS